MFILAGKTTTDEELEEMLESGNPSIFTSDVCISSPVTSVICLFVLPSRSVCQCLSTYVCIFCSTKDYIRLPNN